MDIRTKNNCAAKPVNTITDTCVRCNFDRDSCHNTEAVLCTDICGLGTQLLVVRTSAIDAPKYHRKAIQTDMN
jgi:hypothetical protein